MTHDVAGLQIAYIGGGSRNWARNLILDLACAPELGGEVLLYDIDPEAARRNETFGNWVQTLPTARSRWRYRAVERLEQALAGADFVFIAIQPGPLEMMDHEIAVAEKYGLFYPVGDTTGAPGLMRGLRSAIIFAGLAHSIAAACPRAWVINYTNPMTICTRTLTRVEPALKVFGCCHEVFGTQDLLAGVALRALGLEDLPPRDEIRVNVLGINHFTWLDRASYRGHDLLALLREEMARPGTMREFTREEVEARGTFWVDNYQVKYALFRRYGILPAAGDRHLVEFVPGFIGSPEELFRWGLIRTPVSIRIAAWHDYPRLVSDYVEGRRPLILKPTEEEAIRQVRALLGLGDFVTNVNRANVGQAPDLPLGVVVETNARFSRDLVQPLTAGPLPPGVHALVARHVANQEMTIEAAQRRDKELAFQAIFNDPTVHLPVDRAWAMFEEIGLPQGWW